VAFSELIMSFGKVILLSAMLALLAVSCVSQVFAEADEAEARVALDSVAFSLQKAYVSVAGAETAGANVAELKVSLSYAGSLLANGEASFRVGNFGDAVGFALSANASVKDVETAASMLAISARESRSQRFYWAVLESSIGISVVVFVVLACWVYFRRQYVRGILDFKPEVSKVES
jgi:hypothetical protein